MKLSKKHTRINDGPMGPAYVWELDNGYGFIVIDLFSHYQNMYGEKYEVLVRNPAGNYIEERSNIH